MLNIIKLGPGVRGIRPIGLQCMANPTEGKVFFAQRTALGLYSNHYVSNVPGAPVTSMGLNDLRPHQENRE